MARAERVALPFLVLVFILIIIEAANIPENNLEILSRLLHKRPHHHRNPVLLILVPHSSNQNSLLRTSNNNVLTNGDEIKAQDNFDNIDKEKAKKYIKDILRTTGDENDPEVKETNQKFLRALRSQCSKYTKCRSMCPEKKKAKCQKSCKEVFDYLMLCHPPGGKKKEKKHKKKKIVDSCAESEDECTTTTKDPCETREDSCAESDSCEPITCKPKRGRTMKPTWRM